MIARSGFFRHFPAIWQTRQSGSSMLCKPILLQAGPLKFSRPKTVRRAEQIVLSYWSSHRRNRTPVSGHYGTRKGPLLRRQVSMSLTSFLAGAAAVIAAVYALIRYLEKQGDLRLPAPSFKPVGPSKKFAVAAESEGVYSPNNFLQKAQVMYHGAVSGSESVAVDDEGKLYMLDKFGFVLKAASDGKDKPVKVTHLGPGRPLGFHFNSKGDLLICNAGTGLQSLEKASGKVVLLSSVAPKNPGSTEETSILYANDLSIAKDGSVYFTDSTDIPPAYSAAGFYDTMASYILTLLQGDHAGRLLHYSSEGKTTCIADGFFYANGVEVDHDQRSVLVVETCLSKVTRVWLDGPKAGSKEVFIENLPGYPDGFTKGVDGSYWISLITLKQPGLEKMLNSRLTRWLMPKIPASLKKINKAAAVLQVSPEGKILRYMADSTGGVVSSISAVTETEKGLYIGNLGGDFVSFLDRANYSPVLAH